MRSSSAATPWRRILGLSQLFLLGCLVAFGVVLKASYEMTEASAYQLPRAVSIFGLLLASLELARSVRRGRAPGASPAGGDVTGPAAGSSGPGGEASEPAGAASGPEAAHGLGVLATIAFTAAYFAAVPLLGFPLATAASIAAFGWLTRFPRKRLVAILAVAVPIVLHVTFGELLQAPLPAGVLGALRF